MRRLLLRAGLLLSAALPLCLHAAEPLMNMSEHKPALILDVRTPDEFAGGHIAGAVNIPVDQVATEIRKQKGINADSPILVYCQSGRRSARAKQTLEALGYTHITDGGAFSNLRQTLK